MALAFYIYTIVVMGAAFVACSVALMAWIMTRRRDCLVAGSGFALYAIGLALIFFDEYIEAKYDYSVTFDLPLQHPILTTVLGIGVIACVWTYARMRTHARVTFRSELAFLAPFSLGCFLLVPRESAASALQQYLYWIWRDLGVVTVLAWVAWRYRTRATKVERLDMERSRKFFIAACVLICMVMFEDTFMIMLYRPTGALAESSFFWYLGERNISENMLMLACIAQLIMRFRSILVVYARHPRADASLVSNAPESVPEEEVESRIVLFADACGLSKREQEVLRLVLRGLDAQNIASELFISQGTVKTHLHRIYRKSEVSGREELIEAFWRS